MANTRVCRFFSQGRCNKGDNCSFVHEKTTNTNSSANQSSVSIQQTAQISLTSQPAPVQLYLPPECPIFSIDVECVASGVSHNKRSIAQFSVVDQWCRPVFNAYVRQENPVFSYITELTGLTQEILETHGIPFKEALDQLRMVLPKNCILIGQNILKDVEWLGLKEGLDYFSLVDIAALFRVWNPKRGEFTYFSQDHYAKVWLGLGERNAHNAIEDAQISISLFNAFLSVRHDSATLARMNEACLSAQRSLGFSATHPEVDGCCMGNRKKCTCGDVFL